MGFGLVFVVSFYYVDVVCCIIEEIGFDVW